MSTALGRLNCKARSQNPFCKSLRIRENEIACGHAKTVSQSEGINLNSLILKEACQKMRWRSKQQGTPWTLTEVNYY